MKRNIIPVIKFGNGKIYFTVIEQIANHKIEIFNSFSKINKSTFFLEKSIKEIEDKIGGKIKDVTVLIDPSKKIKSNITLDKQILQIPNGSVSKKDINNIIGLTKKDFENENNKVILVQPLQFKVFEKQEKSYSKAPIGKKGTKLEVVSMITTISMDTYNYISQVIKASGLSIKEILLTSQAISHNNLSPSALASGAILIHIGQNQSFVAINKNFATIKTLSFYDHGFKNLITGISKIFSCNKDEAENIIAIYGTLKKEPINKVVFYKEDQNKKIVHSNQLNEIIKMFVSNLFIAINKFIDQNNVEHLPIVISGNITKINNLLEYAKEKFTSKYVSIYNPTSFIEVNTNNWEALGVVNYIKITDEIMGRQINTIIETNPHFISSLNMKKNISMFSRIINKIGGKNVWK